MNSTLDFTTGDYIRVRDLNGNVVGGGEVTAIDDTRVITAQPYKHTHNGVTIEQGTTPARWTRAGWYTFEKRDA
jgi:hypothetical protein